MARYKKIDVRIWNDAKFNALSSDARLIFLFMLTSPQTTMVGAVPVDKHTVSRILKFDEIRYGIGYKQLSEYGMLEYDEAGIFWIKNFLKYNPPENPKVVISWSSLLDLFPECQLLIKIAKSVLKACETRGEAYVKALHPEFKKLAKYDMSNGMPYGITYPMPYQEQEQEQEQDKEIHTHEHHPKAFETFAGRVCEKETPLKTAPVEQELPLQRTTVSKTETVEKKSKVKRQKKEKIPCPFKDGDQIPEDYLTTAKRYGVQDPQSLFDSLIAYCKAKDVEYADYKAAFTTFCINDKAKREKKSQNQFNNAPPFEYEPPGGFTDDYYRDQCEFDEHGKLKL